MHTPPKGIGPDRRFCRLLFAAVARDLFSFRRYASECDVLHGGSDWHHRLQVAPENMSLEEEAEGMVGKDWTCQRRGWSISFNVC